MIGDPFVPFDLERWFASHAGGARIDLTSSGAPPLALNELLAVAASTEREAFDAISLGYGPPEGALSLRGAIAARYCGLDAADVIVTCGAIEALRIATEALVRPGDEVIVQSPMYPAVAALASSRGAAVVRWPLERERGFVASPDDLEKRITPRTVLVAITQPNSPSGSVMERGALDEVGGMLAARGIWLLSDEVYRDLTLEHDLVVPSAIDDCTRVLTVGDVAKPFGLGGLRIGWIVARDPEMRARLAARRDFTTLSPPTPSVVLAEIALRHADRLLERPLANARANLECLRALAMRSDSLDFALPRAGATAFVRVADADGLQRELAARGILVVPGSFFGQADHLRIGLAGPPDEFAAFLGRLEEPYATSAVSR